MAEHSMGARPPGVPQAKYHIEAIEAIPLRPNTTVSRAYFEGAYANVYRLNHTTVSLLNSLV